MTFRHVALLIALPAIIFFTCLGTPRLWDRDEPRNAGASRGMLQSGDWVVPRFNGELRTHKPVLINWFMMSAYAVFPDEEFAARFWSAALGVGTVLMTYAIGRRLFNPAAAMWGGVALATNLLFTMMARLATPEMLFVFFLTAAMLVYVHGTFRTKRNPVANDVEPAGSGTERAAGPDDGEHGEDTDATPPAISNGGYFPRAWPVVALMYGLMGMAVLAKGPAGLVLPTAVIGLFLLVMRLPAPRRDEAGSIGEPRTAGRAGRWLAAARAMLRPFGPRHFFRTAWSMRPLTALLVAAGVALPWYLMVWRATNGEWVRGFIFEHNVGRAAKPMEGHGGDLWQYPLMVLLFYPLTLLVGFFPWSVLSGAFVSDLVRRIRRRDPWGVGYIFLACWAAVYIVAFSIARTKLASYMTPMYPALSLVAGVFLYRWTRNRSPTADRSVPHALGLLACVGGLLILGLAIGAGIMLHGDWWLGLVGLVPLVGGLAAMRLAGRGQRTKAATVLAVTAAGAAIGFVATVVRVDRYQHSYPLIAAIRARSSAPRIATFNRHEPSWVYYANQRLEDYRRAREAAEFLAASPDAFIITSDDRMETLARFLPPDTGVLATTPYFGQKGNLVVVGRRVPAPSAPATTQRSSPP